MFARHLACLVVSVTVLAAPALAGDAARAGEREHVLKASDSCTFFRSQAYNHGLDDFSTEMLMACQQIARRHAAGVPLGDRLTATEAILDTYRKAVVAAATAAYERKREGIRAPWARGLSQEEKRAIADETGALLALEVIRTGF